MKTYSFTDFRKKFMQILSEVKAGETVSLTRYGEKVAQIVPIQPLIEPAKSNWHTKVKKFKLESGITTTEILSRLRDEEN